MAARPLGCVSVCGMDGGEMATEAHVRGACDLLAIRLLTSSFASMALRRSTINSYGGGGRLGDSDSVSKDTFIKGIH